MAKEFPTLCVYPADSNGNGICDDCNVIYPVNGKDITHVQTVECIDNRCTCKGKLSIQHIYQTKERQGCMYYRYEHEEKCGLDEDLIKTNLDNEIIQLKKSTIFYRITYSCISHSEYKIGNPPPENVKEYMYINMDNMDCRCDICGEQGDDDVRTKLKTILERKRKWGKPPSL